MNREFAIPAFEDEEQFRAWYLKLLTAREHLLALREWRVRQSKMVGSLGQIIGHFGGEQYTEVDHFLLELIQNADDNTYAQGVSPELAITLQSSGCSFVCNEAGFNPENVFAICYAAASTKKREPGKRSFIGEKGIGFKSLFSVADAVEIHSGDYHFELRDKEYIVPHLLEGAYEAGSRIVVRFKASMPDIGKLLSGRLVALSQSADHFVLFLQRLEKLIVDDRIAGSNVVVQIKREDDQCVVQQGESIRSYRMVTESVQFPENIVQDRFDHLSGALERDVCFAVPYPEELEKGPHKGALFCFLPTRVETGFPFHIQIDGKTTTNRENIESAARSKWNRHLLGELRPAITKLFLKLRDDKTFRDHLPLFFPDPKAHQTGNDDLNAVLAEIVTALKEEPLALDRNEDFRPASKLRLAPKAMVDWVETDQYAGHLGEGLEFLHPNWRKHGLILAEYSCVECSASKLAELFVKGGCPKAVVVATDEEVPRNFLDQWITLKPSATWERVKLKAAPIYPIKAGQSRRWGPITETTLLVSLDGREVPVPGDSQILDPVFTYSPGGTVAESIRSFNERFRTYLTDVLKVKRASDAQYIEDVLIPNIQAECEKPVTDSASLRAHTERWVELYSRIWWRQKTIVNDSSEDRFATMLRKLGECKIATSANGQTGWELCPLKDALLPKPWWNDQSLAQAYADAGATLISLVLEEVYEAIPARQRRSESKFDPDEWTGFLKSCGARQGPQLIRTEFPTGDGLPEKVVAFHKECETVHTNSRKTTITTTDFDPITCKLLTNPAPIASLAGAICRLWPKLGSEETVLEWFYYSNQTRIFKNSAALCRIAGQLLLGSDQGMADPTSAVLDTPENRPVAVGLIPMIDPSRYPEADFLRYLGVTDKLDEAYLEARATEATGIREDSEFVDASETLLRLAARLAKFRTEGRTWIRTARIFPHRIKRTLLGYDDWLDQKGEEGFSGEVIDLVFESMESVADSSIEALVKELFDLGDLIGRHAEIIVWMKAVGVRLRSGRHEEVDLEFANRLRDQGLVFSGQTVKSPDHLPLLWDRFPNPCSPAGFLLLPEDPSDRTICELAAKAIAWPRLSQRTVRDQCSHREDGNQVTLKQVQLTAQSLQSKFSRIKGASFGRSDTMRMAKDGRLIVADATEISLTIDRCNEQPTVPFWMNGKTFLYDSEHVELPEALGQIIDAEASTTIAPFIKAIFDQQETPAKQAIAGPRKPKDPDPAPGPNPVPPGNGGDNPPPPPPPNPPGVRKRLFSYVSRKKDGKGNDKTPRSPDTKAKTDVELAGEKMLTDFCKKHGLACKDVTAENKGYDFEIQCGAGLFLVELKSSRDRWDHWENSMTINEFKSAIDHRINYVLCVAELVHEPNGLLTFIQDPWGQADGFLFDSPWKQVATDPGQLFSILEDSSGTPPPRTEDSQF